MEIIITYGTGCGNTKLSAFDSALNSAGIANYNLIKLSSIIPKGARVLVRKFRAKKGEYGNKLYVVIASKVESEQGKTACAGLGWFLDREHKGVLVEHVGSSKQEVAKLIETSLKDLAKIRGIKNPTMGQKIVSIECKEKPVCALVCAVFKSEPF